MIGRGAFQETDFFGMTLPMVKHSYLVTGINDIPRIVKEAFHIAQTGRPGPVVIDMPKDVQDKHHSADLSSRGEASRLSPAQERGRCSRSTR